MERKKIEQLGKEYRDSLLSLAIEICNILTEKGTTDFHFYADKWDYKLEFFELTNSVTGGNVLKINKFKDSFKIYTSFSEYSEEEPIENVHNDVLHAIINGFYNKDNQEIFIKILNI